MNPQALSNLNKNIIYMRSNSIKRGDSRNEQKGPLQPISLSLKLNQKQFPVDFFKRSNKTSVKNKQNNYSSRAKKITSIESQNQCDGAIIANDWSQKDSRLEQFQVTSFFQCGVESVETIDSGDVRSNENNIQVSEFTCGISQKICNSIQLTSQKQHQSTQLLCTFSKIPISLSKQTSPQKKFIDIKLPHSQNLDIEYSHSMRPATKTQHRQYSKIEKLKSRRSSIDKGINTHRSELQYLREASLQKIGKPVSQFIGLPPISRKR